MCFAGVADAVDDRGNESAIACRFWKHGTCRWGDKCKWKHEGPAGVAAVAKRQGPRGKGTTKKTGKSMAHELKAMLLELLSGIATKIDCTVFSLLTKICGRVQTRQKTQLSPQISQNSSPSAEFVATPLSPLQNLQSILRPVNSEIKIQRGNDADGRTDMFVRYIVRKPGSRCLPE
jgi:hypothetical protein